MIEHSVLKYNPETKKVEIDPQALTVDYWKELHSADRTPGKKYFQNAITFIYFFAYPESPYENYLDRQKISHIKKNNLPEDVVDKILKDSKITRCISGYKDSVLPVQKRHYEMFKQQVDQFYTDVMSLPTNSEKAEQKYKLMSYADKLMDLEEKMKKKVENERKSTVKQQHRKRLFEDR